MDVDKVVARVSLPAMPACRQTGRSASSLRTPRIQSRARTPGARPIGNRPACAKLSAAGRRYSATRLSRHQTSWSAAGSEAPRRFGCLGRPPKSGVAAALCHRTPKSSRLAKIPNDTDRLGNLRHAGGGIGAGTWTDFVNGRARPSPVCNFALFTVNSCALVCAHGPKRNVLCSGSARFQRRPWDCAPGRLFSSFHGAVFV